MESNENKIKVVFDVVNSVKGGSGKSTISLLLASYFASQKNTVSYIIDLDLRGTSWVNNYIHYMTHEDGMPVAVDEHETGRKIIYINDLMNDFGRYKASGFFVKLKTEYDNSVPVSGVPEEPGTVYLCAGQPSASEDIDDLRIDLFENAVFHIIDHIYERHCQSDGKNKIHIILDMPPSYESHAERILRCLLSGVDSRLYMNVRRSVHDGGKYKAFAPYVVNLYMISLWSPAHINSNMGYIKNLFNKQVYASALNGLIRDVDRRLPIRFCVRFVGNDATNAISDLGLQNSGKQASDAIAKYIQEDFTSNDLSGYDCSMYGEEFIDAISLFPIVHHLPFLYNKDFFSNPRSTTKGDVVPLPAQAYDEIAITVQKSLGGPKDSRN